MTLALLPLVIHERSKEAIRAGLSFLFYSIGGAFLGLAGFFISLLAEQPAAGEQNSCENRKEYRQKQYQIRIHSFSRNLVECNRGCDPDRTEHIFVDAGWKEPCP